MYRLLYKDVGLLTVISLPVKNSLRRGLTPMFYCRRFFYLNCEISEMRLPSGAKFCTVIRP